MSFLSDELVTEHDYLLLERRLRELFPKLTVALRIASPSLGEKFLADLNRYKPVLTDFLRRQSPALAAWIADTGWSLEDGRILLTCPDQIAMGFFRSHHLDEKLSQAIYDIFRVRTPVALTVCGEREAWVEKMRADRGFSFAASPMPDDEPPPWDDAELDAQAAALFGGAPGEGAGPAAPAAPAAPAPRTAHAAPRATAPKKPAAPKGGPVLKGRAVGDVPVPIGELAEDSGIVVIEGTVTGVNDPKELKGGETVLASFAVYDDTSTIYCKAFYNYRVRRAARGETPDPPTKEERARVMEQIGQIKNGMRVRLRGDCRMDPFLNELSVSVRDMQQMPKIERMDTAAEKRIELHMHTTMSTMDATADAGVLIAQAAKWGHPAVAITDHGSAQAFPAAFGAAKKQGIKLIPAWRGICATWSPSSPTRTTAPSTAPSWCWTLKPRGFRTPWTASSKWAPSSWKTGRSWAS